LSWAEVHRIPVSLAVSSTLKLLFWKLAVTRRDV